MLRAPKLRLVIDVNIEQFEIDILNSIADRIVKGQNLNNINITKEEAKTVLGIILAGDIKADDNG